MARTRSKAILLVAATVATVVATAAPAGAATTACSVQNGSQTFGTLQAAITAASGGDQLVIAGTCTGPFGIDKDLTLVGRKPGTHRPVLTGAGVSRVLVVSAPAVVALTDVIVRDGNSTGPGGGGGINSSGTLALTRVLVTHNSTVGAGGGILNLGDMTVTRSLVSDNQSGFDGGGIYNAGDLTTWRTDLVGNVTTGVGGGMFSEGVATMHGGQVTRNTATDVGGGILTVNTLVLDRTRVFGNVPDDCVC